MEERNILLVAPYSGLLNLCNDIIEKYAYPVQAVQGSIKNIEDIIRSYQNKCTEVIISRGGTYYSLKKISDIPVVEIKVNLFDIMRILKDIKCSNKYIGFIGYDNVVFGEEGLREIFDVNLFKISLQEGKNDYKKKISQAINMGITVFVGDNIGINIITDMGLTGYIVESGRDTIISAIEEALRVREIRRKEQALAKRFELVMDYINDGIIAIDGDNKVTVFNKAAEKLCSEIKLSKNELIDIVGMNSEINIINRKIGEIKELKNKHIFAINKSPILINDINYGAIATIQSAIHIQKIEQEIRKKLSNKGLVAKYTFDDIICKSRIMKEIVKRAKKYSTCDSTVLIIGETGNGKELFAHGIHNSSSRCMNPFVAVNCAALPENLLESELFGYVEGAFTGAKKGGKIGLFELAHMGTIFLDEIGDMPYNLQTRLLRVLQEKEVMRIGDDKVIPINIRVIASTNRDLQDLIKSGRFRRDLYYRLNILLLDIPPLRYRKDDIRILANSFIREFSSYRDGLKGIGEDAMLALLNYTYEGNVRELRGLIERAVIISEGNYISLKDLGLPEKKYNDESNKTLKEIEIDIIKDILNSTGDNYSKAAEILGIDRSTIYRKLKD